MSGHREGDHSECGLWTIVSMPDGYRVCALPQYDECQANGLFGMAVEGLGEHGEKTTVRGTYIARVSRREPSEAEKRKREQAHTAKMMSELRYMGNEPVRTQLADALVVDDRTWVRGRVA